MRRVTVQNIVELFRGEARVVFCCVLNGCIILQRKGVCIKVNVEMYELKEAVCSLDREQWYDEDAFMLPAQHPDCRTFLFLVDFSISTT